MYLERKADGDSGRGPARIGRVTFSKTGRTVYYAGRELRRIRRGGIAGNYEDVATGDEWWISGPKRDGRDRLAYYEGTPVEIDEDVRVEYWTEIRGRPDLADRTRA
jgi:hypothetical protein